MYRGKTPGRVSDILHMTGLLAGALVVGNDGMSTRAADRILVIMGTPDSAGVAWLDTAKRFNLDFVHPQCNAG